MKYFPYGLTVAFLILCVFCFYAGFKKGEEVERQKLIDIIENVIDNRKSNNDLRG